MRFVYVCQTCSARKGERVQLGRLRARWHALRLHRVFRIAEWLAVEAGWVG